MILEVAVLNIKNGLSKEFEKSFLKAQKIIQKMPGYYSHQLQQCLEKPGQYILLVEWDQLEHHINGFRTSQQYGEWKKLLHHYYDPFPVVEHYQSIYKNKITNV